MRLERIAPGQYKGIIVLDRWTANPSLEDLVTEDDPIESTTQIGLPRYYNVLSTASALPRMRIHYSRAWRLGGADLPFPGWPEDREVWTGSCPCQPLSSAGQRKGHTDVRHLWPAFYRLIAERRPATIFGEQVASQDGREWLAGVRADLEALGYVVGCADLPAASTAAPHIRQRLFWVAVSNADGAGWANNCGRPGSKASREIGIVTPEYVLSPRLPGWPLEPPESWVVDDGDSVRVAAVRAYGNAIVPQVAAEFIKASMEAEGDG